MKLTLLGLFCLFGLSGFAQTLTYGPIVGGVTDTSCNIFIGTSAPAGFTILLSKTPPFGSIVASGVGTTDPSDSVGIVHIGGLTPNTQYYMRVTINGVPISTPAKFSTLLAPDSVGHQVFLTGAGIGTINDEDSAIFIQAENENAKGFIEIGNWSYPDSAAGCIDIYLNGPPTSWAATYSNVQSLYKQRYTSNSLSFIQSLGLDYVYDDHDYMNEKAGKSLALGYLINPFNGILGSPVGWGQPAQARLNSIKGYLQYFPGYTLHDSTDGIYHSFRSGNAEFFVLDTRSARGFQVVCVDTIGGTSNWQYKQDPASHLLGNEQMQWLKNALSQSTATWKFIVSSVPFNMGMRFALDTLIKIGGGDVPYWNPKLSCNPFGLLGTHAYSSTNHFADLWAGFKADGDSLLSYILSYNIPNVFVVSGNCGTVGLDDGTNSGLPELMSANMKISNSKDALTYQNFMGFNIWDIGGSGLCNQHNFNSTYGKIEVFNNDSIRLSAVDETGTEVTGANFYAGAAYKYNPAYSPFRIPSAVADVVSMNEDSSAVINVLANDSDYNANALYVNLQANPGHGSATVNTNNTITYVPDTGFYGIDTFYCTACDHTNPVCGNCASAMVTIHVTKVSGLNVLPNAIRFNIYPNPADDVLFVSAAGNTDAVKFVLINSVGQQLQQVSFTDNLSIDISKYAAGNYFYNILDRDSQLIKVGKIMVVR